MRLNILYLLTLFLASPMLVNGFRIFIPAQFSASSFRALDLYRKGNAGQAANKIRPVDWSVTTDTTLRVEANPSKGLSTFTKLEALPGGGTKNVWVVDSDSEAIKSAGFKAGEPDSRGHVLISATKDMEASVALKALNACFTKYEPRRRSFPRRINSEEWDFKLE